MARRGGLGVTSQLEGQVALITGGAGTLGGAMALALAQAGATALIGDLPGSVPDGRALPPGVAAYLPVDVSEEAGVRAMFAHIEREYRRLDILVNCAGFDTMVEVAAMSLEQWQRMLAVHLTGTFLCTREAIGLMARRSYGRIINITSQLAYKGAAGSAHYCAAKAGVLGFTRSVAREVAAQGILVNAVAPGPVDSPLLRASGEEWIHAKLAELPLGRLGLPEEIAATVLLLASPGGSYYAGQTLAPCGGDVML